MKARKPPREVVLVGFMGAGKSSVGRILARRLGAEFVDVDARIEDAAGKRVEEIFSSDGEQTFREWERKAIRDAVSGPGRVIATGGGAFLDRDNRHQLKSYAPVVFLDVSPGTALDRLAGDTSRPLLSGKDREKRVGELMERRRPAYLEADFRVSTENLPADRVAEIVFLLISREKKRGPSEGRPGRGRRRG